MGQPNVTRYQGLARILPFGATWELFKTIESIDLIAGAQPAQEMLLFADGAQRTSPDAVERFTVTSGATLYEVTAKNAVVRITLDMRTIHDFSTENRRYTIQDVPGGHVITYHCAKYAFCLAILGGKAASFHDTWREREYPFDKARGTLARLWVNEALTYHVDTNLSLRFGVGWTPATAIADANRTQPAARSIALPAAPPAHASALGTCVVDVERALLNLPMLGSGIIAGYPWFYQVYTRDEAISAGALIALGAHEHAKKALIRAVDALHEDGRISNRTPDSELASADGVGWAFLRLRQLHAQGALSDTERSVVHDRLRRSIDGLEKHWLRNGLMHNAWKETWMDTTGGSNDGRPGARIEIQALTYSMYSFAATLCEAHGDGDAARYRAHAQQLREAVREQFFDAVTGSLADGIDDHVDRTARPNIFLAAYAAADFFSLDEWKRIFTYAIDRLWLPWGGLATIDKEHMLFVPTNTGEDDRSYHRGDSWYFVNNIAALCLWEAGFHEQAHALFAGSVRQIHTLGIPGHAAETSSAAQQEANGCFVQTWSAATFIELSLALQTGSSRPGLPRFASP